MFAFSDSLNSCCKHFSIISKIDEDSSFTTTEVDHLLGYYRIEGVHNDVFYYQQKTIRHNIFEKTEPKGLNIKFVPVLLNVYLVCNTYKAF